MNTNQADISYTLVGDYYLPNLKFPKVESHIIGRFGHERLNYLKTHCRLTYLNLLTTGKLNAHLQEIEETANDRLNFVSNQMAQYDGVTEKLKANDPMLWVQKMNNIQSRIIEIIRKELIYT